MVRILKHLPCKKQTNKPHQGTCGKDHLHKDQGGATATNLGQMKAVSLFLHEYNEYSDVHHQKSMVFFVHRNRFSCQLKWW